ncbi:hypothetical protein KUCAC02_007051 [Chaenocephalus aceratus]|nr:hypothetical protein KUCAC02_007051 [Chaenocephalus aceratus]
MRTCVQRDFRLRVMGWDEPVPLRWARKFQQNTFASMCFFQLRDGAHGATLKQSSVSNEGFASGQPPDLRITSCVFPLALIGHLTCFDSEPCRKQACSERTVSMPHCLFFQILEERKHQSSSTRKGRTYPTGRKMRSRGELLRAGLAVMDGLRWGGNTYVALAASPVTRVDGGGTLVATGGTEECSDCSYFKQFCI